MRWNVAVAIAARWLKRKYKAGGNRAVLWRVKITLGSIRSKSSIVKLYLWYLIGNQATNNNNRDLFHDKSRSSSILLPMATPIS